MTPLKIWNMILMNMKVLVYVNSDKFEFDMSQSQQYYICQEKPMELALRTATICCYPGATKKWEKHGLRIRLEKHVVTTVFDTFSYNRFWTSLSGKKSKKAMRAASSVWMIYPQKVGI